MTYYILTQGTKSEEYSIILKNGSFLNPHKDEQEREKLKNIIYETEKRGKIVDSKYQIIKYRSNYLFRFLTKNTDRIGRRVPVELLIINQKPFLKDANNESFLKSYDLLEKENILVDESTWKDSLKLVSDQELSLKNRTRNFILFGIFIVIIILLILIKVSYGK